MKPPKSALPKVRAPAEPIFFDPTAHRWAAMKLLSSVALVFVICLSSVVLFRIFVGPEVELSLSQPAERLLVRQRDAFEAQSEVEPIPANEGVVADAASFFPQGNPSEPLPQGPSGETKRRLTGLTQ